ncbi:hypothetical protein [Thermococcus sp.]
MKKYYCKIYSPSKGLIEDFIVLAKEDKEAALGAVSYMLLKTFKDENAYTDDTRFSVKPLWMAYKSGELENAEVSLLNTINASNMVKRLDAELKKRRAKQASLATWGVVE